VTSIVSLKLITYTKLERLSGAEESTLIGMKSKLISSAILKC
jgi:hypothetical protein